MAKRRAALRLGPQLCCRAKLSLQRVSREWFFESFAAKPVVWQRNQSKVD
jgi:hypothetical protein